MKRWEMESKKNGFVFFFTPYTIHLNRDYIVFGNIRQIITVKMSFLTFRVMSTSLRVFVMPRLSFDLLD